MTDLAREAGVSRSTVSLVLRDSPLVKRETRHRVEEAIERLGYVYNRNAANLRRRTSDMVAMIINDLTNPFFAELAFGLEEALEAAGYVSLMANTGEDPVRQRQVMETMREHGAAGFILCPATGTETRLVAAMSDWNVPVIQVMRWLPGVRLGSVVPDYALGMRMAAEHLLALGHRRIAFLGGIEGNVVTTERVRGYRAALDAAGIAPDPSLIVPAAVNPGGGIEALRAALALESPPTAALCFSDVVAFGVLDASAAAGLKVGRDFSVIGFDDVAGARHTLPPLTTVAVYPGELGRRSAAALLRRIADPSEPPEQEILAPSLVVRGTCGPAPTKNPQA
ncbi:MAG: LacI family DNA-binding transcriptional regulator [Rhodospirillales bacterium]|nr:LacI family DNA-binding transcriptional regulator [Rhodospirillales bacterium]